MFLWGLISAVITVEGISIPPCLLRDFATFANRPSTFSSYISQTAVYGHPCEILACTRYHAADGPPPLAIAMFDWVLHKDLRRLVGVPRGIFIQPYIEFFDVILGKLDFLKKNTAGAVLVIGAADTHLSANAQALKKIVSSGVFKHIAYIAKDVQMDGVSVSPIGLGTQYLKGREKEFLDSIISSNTSTKMRFPPMIASWGDKHRILDSRVSAAKFVKGKDWIRHAKVPSKMWFGELAKYRFMLSPTGFGLQSSKLMEALLVQTIPISQRYSAAEDLAAMGYPIVVVDEWDEITLEKLEEWWSHLSPRLDCFRWWLTVVGWSQIVSGKMGEILKCGL